MHIRAKRILHIYVSAAVLPVVSKRTATAKGVDALHHLTIKSMARMEVLSVRQRLTMMLDPLPTITKIITEKYILSN